MPWLLLIKRQIKVQHCSRLIGASKQASRKAVALDYIMIKFGNLWSKPRLIHKNI